MTTQTINQASATAVRLIDRVWVRVQQATTLVRRFESRVATEQAIAELSAEQLDDVGIKPGDTDKPAVPVKAGLMANLMSLR